eukprot:COSAG03_NODE_808_length_5767_cov_6.385850_2_plen_88_part_00
MAALRTAEEAAPRLLMLTPAHPLAAVRMNAAAALFLLAITAVTAIPQAAVDRQQQVLASFESDKASAWQGTASPLSPPTTSNCLAAQ